VALREQIDRDSMFEDIVGSSEALRKVLRQVDRVAASDSTVLLLGETGTGKELIARVTSDLLGRGDCIGIRMFGVYRNRCMQLKPQRSASAR
jgi:transcriptional regulator with GAF, ATPase, and Fis domain